MFTIDLFPLVFIYIFGKSTIPANLRGSMALIESMNMNTLRTEYAYKIQRLNWRQWRRNVQVDAWFDELLDIGYNLTGSNERRERDDLLVQWAIGANILWRFSMLILTKNQGILNNLFLGKKKKNDQKSHWIPMINAPNETYPKWVKDREIRYKTWTTKIVIHSIQFMIICHKVI